LNVEISKHTNDLIPKHTAALLREIMTETQFELKAKIDAGQQLDDKDIYTIFGRIHKC